MLFTTYKSETTVVKFYTDRTILSSKLYISPNNTTIEHNKNKERTLSPITKTYLHVLYSKNRIRSISDRNF